MPNSRPAFAALSSLIILQLIMLISLFAGVSPHPPQSIPLFGIAPFLAVSLALAASAMIIGPLACAAGKALSIAAALCALLSFGPQKFVDPQLPLIWPAVIAGQLCAVVIILAVYRSIKARKA